MFSTYLIPDLLKKRPCAYAEIYGSEAYPDIIGLARFYTVRNGVLLVLEVNGLPSGETPCAPSVFGCHIHEASQCTGNAEDPFADTRAHLNPKQCPHPEHAGDLPPLFGNSGYAFMSVFTARFTAEEIINRTIIIHAAADDFTSQPSGSSGKKIACGQIRRASSGKLSRISCRSI